MSEYLRTHPNLFMSDPKEPAFFSDDVGPRRYSGIEEYLAIFAGAQARHKVIAEASTFYIRSDHAIERIRSFRPDARLLAMLRRPTDLVYSYHGEVLKQGSEFEWDVEKAWHLQAERVQGKKVPAGTVVREVEYKWVGSLGTQVERVLQTFPREQVHFILFDDFMKDPRTEYLRLLQFLEIPDDGRVEFPRVNEGVQFKSTALARFPRYLRAKAGGQVRAIKELAGIERLRIIRAFDRFNKVTAPRPPMRPEFRRYLDEVFRDEVVKLEQLIGKDLSAWRG